MERLSSRFSGGGRRSSWSTGSGGGLSDVATVSRSLSSKDVRNSCDDKVVQLVTFQASEQHLLRGVHLSHVLRRGARVFRSSTGSASTYGLSAQVTRLDAFLSHNWDVKRTSKFVALLFHFNERLSGVAILIVAAVLGPLAVAGELPVVDLQTWPHTVGVCCRLLGLPFVFLVTLFLRDLLSVLGYGGPVVFLDKICVHQVDRELQRLALEKLGAFLAKSDTMVVAYTGLYLKKLWTVYEVGSFLILHPVSDIRVVPVSQAILFFVAWISEYLFHVLHILQGVYIPTNRVIVSAFLRAIAGAIFVAVLRNWALECAAIQVRLKTFSVRDCVCAVESDRALLYSNIARLMVASQRVSLDASEEVALEAFDRLLQSKLPSAFSSALGGTAFGYTRWLMIFAMDSGLSGLDALTGAVGYPLLRVLAVANHYLLWLFTLWPLSILLMEWLSRQCLGLCGWRQWAYTLLVIVSVIVPTRLADMAARSLLAVAKTDPATFAVCALLNVLGAWGAWIAMHRCRRQPQPQKVFQDTGAERIGCPVQERDGISGLPTVRFVRI